MMDPRSLDRLVLLMNARPSLFEGVRMSFGFSVAEVVRIAARWAYTVI